MGEDPMLAGQMAVPYIKAAQANGVACCLKHFVLNDQETDRFSVNVNVSERAMREIYLAPFKRAVDEAHVYTIMGSYNLWHGVHCCQHDELLNGILKKEWQWDGALVSDWGGTTDTWQAVTGGLDIEMGTFTDGKLKESEFTYDDYHLAKPFEQLLKEGKVPMSVLDEKVSRVLRVIFRTAMNPNKVIGNQCSEAHYEACRKIGEEGIVLLRNEGKPLLPLDLKSYQHILVVGENATRSLTQGGGSSELKTLRDVSPLEALKQWGGERISYAQGYTLMRAAAKDYGWNLNYGGIALMWRGGCIIRSVFLGKIKEAYDKNPALPNLLLDEYFQGKLAAYQQSWRNVVAQAILAGIPAPTLSSALEYYDGYRCDRLPANLLQAQRDYFGAHTYERTDRPRGEFSHTNWTGHGGDTVAGTYIA